MIYNRIVIVLQPQRVENYFIILTGARLLNLFFKFFSSRVPGRGPNGKKTVQTRKNVPARVDGGFRLVYKR